MTCFNKVLLTFLFASSVSAWAGDCIFNPEDVVSFCTEENELGISYPAGTDGVDIFPKGIGCLGSAPSGAWYAMQIEDPGVLAIRISHSEGEDVDFACFGPFSGDSKMDMLKSVCANSSIFDIDLIIDSYTPSFGVDYWDYTFTYDSTCITAEQAAQIKAEVDLYQAYQNAYSDLYDEAYQAYVSLYGEPDYDWDDSDNGEERNPYSEFIDKYIEDRADQLPDYHKMPDDPSVYDITNPCFRGNTSSYPVGKMIDCSYSANSNEVCYIPNAKKGEWYLLLLTNYSQKPGTISFYKQAGDATTNCSIIVDASCNGPYCEGDNIELTVNNAPEGASFLWTGPNGFSSTKRSPSIPQCKLKDAGSYSVVMYANGMESPEVEVKVEVSKADTTTLNESILEGESYYFAGKDRTSAGTYTDLFQNEGGCDSLVVLNLKVTEKPEEPTEPEVEPTEPEVEPTKPEVEPVVPVEPVIPEPQDTVVPDSVKLIVPVVVLTPNGDGINDVWSIQNIEQYPDAVISIYDRFGRKIYCEDHYTNLKAWDGNYNGNPMPSSDYWYLIDIESIDHQYTGHFTLIR